MARLPILTYPDPRLRDKAQTVDPTTEDLQTLVEDMAETMYDANGVGLAATQVGVDKRVVVIDCDPGGPESELIPLINPEVLAGEGESFEEEGCLSVPGYTAKVKRSARVKARWQDLRGEVHEVETEGLLAIALQHEIDHLDGTLFIDHLSALKRELFRKKYKKMHQVEPA